MIRGSRKRNHPTYNSMDTDGFFFIYASYHYITKYIIAIC